MTQHRPTGSPVPGPLPDDRVEPDELADSIAAALRSREPDAAHTAATAQRIATRIAATADGDRSGVVTPFVRRAGRIAVTGVITSTVVVAGATAAAAANPYSGYAAVVDGVVQAVGVDWSSMPAGYTREQYEAFWGAGFTSEDLAALNELWRTDSLETKARAGQLLVDGESVPVVPGSSDPDEKPTREFTPEEQRAFGEAGYTVADAEQLAELWQTDVAEAKAVAGEMLLDGRTPPVP